MAKHRYVVTVHLANMKTPWSRHEVVADTHEDAITMAGELGAYDVPEAATGDRAMTITIERL